jgi:hypothetical protein
MVVLIFMKWTAINWNSQILSTTCLDPDGVAGVVLIMRGGMDCIATKVVTCTRGSYSCTGSDDTAAKCDYNFSGSGDGANR